MDYFDILLAKKLNVGGTNAIYKQTLSNLPSPIATFTGADAPIDELIVSIDAVQSGSGDPSPTNIRPISGWSGANVANIADSEKVRIFNGLLNGTYAFIKFDGSENWGTTSGVFRVDVTGYKKDSIVNGICNKYQMVTEPTQAAGLTTNGTCAFVNSDIVSRFMVKDSSFASVSDFQTWLASNNIYVIYELATQTTPTITASVFNELLRIFNISGLDLFISFSSAVYGGYLNVSTGVLTVTHACIDMGDMAWTYSSADVRFRSTSLASVANPPSSNSDIVDMICSVYKTNSLTNYANGEISMATSGNVFLKDSNYTDSTSLITAVTGQMLVYELATPTTIQLTPTQVRTILGDNNAFADCGEVTELKYYSETP